MILSLVLSRVKFNRMISERKSQSSVISNRKFVTTWLDNREGICEHRFMHRHLCEKDVAMSDRFSKKYLDHDVSQPSERMT